MAITSSSLQAKLQGEFSAELCTVEDIGECTDGSKFKVVLVSERFAGQGLLARQRAVNDCLKVEMESIHALTMKCWTPEQARSKLPDYEEQIAAATAAAGAGGEPGAGTCAPAAAAAAADDDDDDGNGDHTT